MNAVEKEKQETTTQDIPHSEIEKTNPELESLNKQIIELTEKNTEFLVSL